MRFTNPFYSGIMWVSCSVYDVKIVSYDLHGMPAPSLGMLMKMCIAMETWLADDENNVVVVHCLVIMQHPCLLIDGERPHGYRLRLSASMAGMGRELFRSPPSLLWPSWRKDRGVDNALAAPLHSVLQHAAGLRPAEERAASAQVDQAHRRPAAWTQSGRSSRCV